MIVVYVVADTAYNLRIKKNTYKSERRKKTKIYACLCKRRISMSKKTKNERKKKDRISQNPEKKNQHHHPMQKDIHQEIDSKKKQQNNREKKKTLRINNEPQYIRVYIYIERERKI